MKAVSPCVCAHESLSPSSWVKERDAWAIVHLLLDVVKGIGGIDSEADQDDVGVGV
jgi:hypothetical protein